MKRITKTAGSLSLVALAVMSSAFAATDEAFWYVGGNIGQTSAKIDQEAIMAQLKSTGLNTSLFNADDRSQGIKLFGGYQFNKNFAVEGGYFNLGKLGYTATTSPSGSLSGNIKLRGLNLDAVGILPIDDKFSALARVGLNYAETKDDFSRTGAVATPTDPSPSKNAVNYKAGLGVQYNLTQSLGLRAEVERYRIDDAVGNQGDINMISLGLVYRFPEKKSAPVRKAETPAPVYTPIMVVVPVVLKTQQYCSILDIQFEIKQDDIQREEKEKLATVGNFMKKYPDTTAVIEGHTDNVGASDFNMKLSQKRADSVVKYLVEDLHIAPSRLSAVGYGDTRPIADNSTTEGKQANRRIGAVIACATDIADLKVAATRTTMAMVIEFDAYKHEIKPEYYEGLRQAANFLKANPSTSLTIEAHSGRFVGVGDQKVQVAPETSMEISQKRAQAVVDYMVNKLGVTRSRLSTAAFGQTRRVSYGTSLEDQKENRRVNFIVNYSK